MINEEKKDVKKWNGMELTVSEKTTLHQCVKCLCMKYPYGKLRLFQSPVFGYLCLKCYMGLVSLAGSSYRFLKG